MWNTIILLQLSISVTAVAIFQCEPPKNFNLQSAVCCHHPWTVLPNKSNLEKPQQHNVDNLVEKFIRKDAFLGVLVDVTNFQRVELYNSFQPIILRWPIPVYENR